MLWLRLIRWQNLLIIFFTQWVAWVCEIRPLKQVFSWYSLVPGAWFWCMSFSTVLIAAAGYVINDYFDIRIDAINKPDKMVLDRVVPRRMGIILHVALNGIALVLAGMVAWAYRQPEWLLLQVACILLLWRYSSKWKRQFMTGNLIVALMTGLTIMTLVLYEPKLQWLLLHQPAFYAPQALLPSPNPAFVLCIYAFFAFLLTWMREVVKDMEDYKGDAEEGCVTMPIRWGLLRSTRFVQALSVVALGLLGYATVRLFLHKAGGGVSISALYLLLVLLLPLLLWTIALPKRATVAHYHAASRQLKFIMVAGILSLFILSAIHYG